ncbi:MAG: TolB family protein, partial [Planctomycetota bacterium]
MITVAGRRTLVLFYLASLLVVADPVSAQSPIQSPCGCGRGHGLPGVAEYPTASGKRAGKSKKKAEKEKSSEKEEKWDVNAPPLETSDVALDTTRGTWMSVDVHPSGEEIVFDLMGDIYTLPLQGGEAKPIAEGLAWEMQPRYSPDGERIAFTSDRAGGDNIWTMKRNGTDPKQISDESYRLLNSPSWSPDGEYIAARKHFTSTRSLGSGEIWLYHRSGGGGLQLNEKPNEQKDL